MNEIIHARAALYFLDPACSRDEWVCVGMAAKAAGLEFEDWHNWSKDGANYKGENDCRNVWQSLDELGEVKAATLFYKARKNGWKDPINTRSNTIHNSQSKEKKDKKSHKGNSKPDDRYVHNIWERCVPALPAHGYIMRKQGIPDGLRVYPSIAPALIIHGENIAGYLVIPCLSDGKPQTLQFIPPNEGSRKLNLGGASFNDGYFSVGAITDSIYLCEGIGQAWAVNKAVECCAVVYFGVSRMMTVAKALRQKYPHVHLVLIADREMEYKAEEVATSVAGQWVELPPDKPSNYDVNDYALEHGYAALESLLACLKTPAMRYKLLSGADLLNTPPMRWLVQGVIPAEGLAALYGASGSGKSFLILDMGCAVAAGDGYWFGRRVTQTPVTYACLEGEGGMGKRVKAWSQYFNKPLPDALRFITEPFDLLSADVSDLAKSVIVTGGAGGLVIIDTLNRAIPGADENSSVDMGNIIAAAKKLQSLIGGLVLLVHHTGKDATKGLRGHSSLYAALDGAIEVIKTDTRREWSIAKSKDDVTGNAHPFKLEIVQVGLDEEGEEITSCVALFDSSKDIFPKKISLGRNQKIALEEIDKLFNSSLHIGKEGAPLLSKCIAYDEALARVAELMPTDAKHRKSRAMSAIAGLIDRKFLGMRGDWLWRI